MLLNIVLNSVIYGFVVSFIILNDRNK